MVKVNWTDAPEDVAVCLCPAGHNLRAATNCGKSVAPLWMLWAAREQVPFERVVLLEDVLTPEEMREFGFVRPVAGAIDEQRLIALGKSRPRPRL